MRAYEKEAYIANFELPYDICMIGQSLPLNFQYNKHDANNNRTTISYKELQVLWGEESTWEITISYLVVQASKALWNWSRFCKAQWWP